MRTLDYEFIIFVANSLNDTDEANGTIEEEEEDSRSGGENIDNVSFYSLYSGNGPFSEHFQILIRSQKRLSVGCVQLLL